MLIATLIGALLQIGSAQLTVEIADTPSVRDQGLMNRDSLAEGCGMLFVYPQPERLCFWMKNTRIPLSIGFFDAEKRLQQIEDMDPPQTNGSSLRLYKSAAPAQYALEVPKHWFKKHKISLGDKFTIDANLRPPIQ